MLRTMTVAEPGARYSDEKLATFVEIAQTQRARLILLAWRMTSRREDAEDIVQEALFKAFRALPRFRGDSRMDTWLHTIARNAALEYLRNRKGKVAVPLEPFQMGDSNVPAQEFPDPDKTPEKHYERRELKKLLRFALGNMTSLNRSAIQMCVLEELPYPSVAKDLNVSIGALKSRVFHGKHMLKRSVSLRIRRREHSTTTVPVATCEGD